MFDDAYQELKEAEKEKFFSLLHEQLDGSPLDPAMTKAYAHPIIFYRRWQIIEAEENQGNSLRRFAAITPINVEAWNAKAFHLMDGTNKKIYELNKEIPIRLNVDRIPPYIKFFFAHVRGGQGKFHIIESVEDINWHEEPAPSGKTALSKLIEKVSVKDSNESEFVARANIIFKDSLFESDITVQKDGTVSLSNQEILVEDLPVKTEKLA